MQEVNDICKIVSASAAQDFNMYWGQVTSPQMGDKISVTVIATGFDNEPKVAAAEPVEQPVEIKPVVEDPNVIKSNELDSILHPGAKKADPLAEKNTEPFSFEENPDKQEGNTSSWGEGLLDSAEKQNEPVRKTINYSQNDFDLNDINTPAILTKKYGRGISLTDD